MAKKPVARRANEIWSTFLKNEEADFVKRMGYGRREIKHIGVKKFIWMNGWSSTADVSKWRTDKLHVVICFNCHASFAIYRGEDNMGLCDKCEPRFDLNKLFKMYEAYNVQGEFEKAEKVFQGFLIYQGVRNDFLKIPLIKKGMVRSDEPNGQDGKCESILSGN